MSEEEIEAIEFVKKLIETIKQSKMLFDEDITAKLGIATQNTLQIVLNLIQKYQTELERLNNLNNHQSKDIKKAVDYTFELNAVTSESIITKINVKNTVILPFLIYMLLSYVKLVIN